MEYNKKSISELRKLYSENKVSPSEVVSFCLDSINSNDSKIEAFLKVFYEDAMKRARHLDGESPEGKPLYGIPVAVKDNICTKGYETTCASKILEGYRPPYNATVVERLLDAGAVIIGKTNMDEFAMGSSTENSAYKITKNPYDTEYAPGGSSGGSAAAVAASMVPVSLGSDTGGSIRQPASLCGVVGLKGTYGRVSRYGLIAFASSLDQIGPITGTVEDSAVVMNVISGRDSRDATTIPDPPGDVTESVGKGPEGMKIAVPRGYEDLDIADEIKEILKGTIEKLKAENASVEFVELPDMDASIACYYILANAEASSNLARYDGVKYAFRAEAESLEEMYERTRGEGFGDEVKRRVLLGTYVLSAGYYDAYYKKAQQVRAMICSNFESLFSRYDLVMLPTVPGTSFRIGERIDNPIEMYLSDIFTTPANIAGLPAISLPAGFAENGLPLGIQLLAGYAGEAKLLRGAAVLERIYGFNRYKEE
ncbi:MAG TPA: Asp-tRNA(Asn)/Glu-tRNA(Gln) amidotransferase subunit GatA [Candidatus Krumholzibacteriaceae bacterium]|nr:Asp-tRNA(Asn)/Glu-tRNA(Gln) amidotransferase subunit GatA [Candidatus Krumholzibacteriaceae bacterium]